MKLNSLKPAAGSKQPRHRYAAGPRQNFGGNALLHDVSPAHHRELPV